MRKIHPSRMIAHLWANASQDEAKNGNGSFFFTGPTLYSWGHHFVVAHFLDTGAGRVVLWNSDGYSVSTSRHQSHAANALRGSDWSARIFIPGMNSDNVHGRARVLRLAEKLLDAIAEPLESARKTSRRSMKRDGLVNAAYSHAANARKLAEIGKEGAGDAASLTPGERAQCRAILATLDKLPPLAAYPDAPADGSEQIAFIETAARVVGTHKAREQMREKMARANSRLADAVGYFETTAAEPYHTRLAFQAVRDAISLAETAAGLAKSYKLRAPAFPMADARKLCAQIEPHAIAYDAAEKTHNARRMLRDAERAYRSREWWRVARWADTLAEFAGIVPAWMTERGAYLVARQHRAAVIESAEGQIKEIVAHVANADSYAANGYGRDAVREYRDALRILERVAAVLPLRHPLRAKLDSYSADTLREQIAAARATFAQEDAARVAAWRDGSNTAGPMPRDMGPLLRLARDGAQIETSWGAMVPVSVAPLLWRMTNAVRAKGEAVTLDSPQRVGHFALEKINADGSIVVGCHEIAFSELQHIAHALNYEGATA